MNKFTSQLDRKSPQYQQWYDFQWGSASQQSLQYSDNLADTVYGHGGYRVFTPPTKVNDVFSRIIRLSGVEGDCLVWHGTSPGGYGRLVSSIPRTRQQPGISGHTCQGTFFDSISGHPLFRGHTPDFPGFRESHISCFWKSCGQCGQCLKPQYHRGLQLF